MKKIITAIIAAGMAMTTMASIGASAANTKNAVINMNTQNAATAIAANNFMQMPEFKSFGSAPSGKTIAKDVAGIGAAAAIKAVSGEGITGALLNKGAEYILGMIFEGEPEPTIADVLNRLDELSDKIDTYHAEEMKELRLINSNIDSKDFRMEADSIKDDYRAVIQKISQYADNITTPGEGVIDETTYETYKEILAQPTSDFSTLEKNFSVMVDYVKGGRSSSDHISGYAVTSNYLMDKIVANYKETNHDWASSPDFFDYLETVNREIELMQSNVVMDYVMILAVNNMAYKVKEYEVENGLYKVKENQKPYSQYERFAEGLTESLKSIDDIYNQSIEDNNNNNGEFIQAVAEIPDAVGGKTVKAFHTFSEAWAQTYRTGSKTYTLKLRSDVIADSSKGFNFDDLSEKKFEFRNNGGFHINEGRNVTIDLGGNTIDCTQNKNTKIFAMNSNTSLTVSNGTIAGGKNIFHSRDRDNFHLTLNNVTLRGSKESAIYFADKGKATCSLTMNGCKMENCGKIYMYSEKALVNVKNSEFVNNVNLDDHGGVFWLASKQFPRFDNCSFCDNHAKSGGAIYAITVDVRNCTFDYNCAGNYEGGAVWAGEIIAVDCTFKGNSARNHGGAIFVHNRGCYDRLVDIEGCTFYTNTAGLHGGAIRLGFVGTNNPGNFRKCVIRDNTFNRNWAVEGAAIYYVEKKNVTNEDIAYNWGNTGKDNDSDSKKDNYWGIY